MTIVIAKNISPALSAALSVKFDPYKTNEARTIMTHKEMIFSRITFDNISKTDAKRTPNVDIMKPKSKINFTGMSKMLPSVFISVPFTFNFHLNASIVK